MIFETRPSKWDHFDKYPAPDLTLESYWLVQGVGGGKLFLFHLFLWNSLCDLSLFGNLHVLFLSPINITPWSKLPTKGGRLIHGLYKYGNSAINLGIIPGMPKGWSFHVLGGGIKLKLQSPTACCRIMLIVPNRPSKLPLLNDCKVARDK